MRPPPLVAVPRFSVSLPKRSLTEGGPLQLAAMAVLVIVPPLTLFADKTIVPIVILAGAAAALHMALSPAHRPIWPVRACVIIGLLVLLGALSVTWSIAPERSLRGLARVAGCGAAAIALMAWMPRFAARLHTGRLALAAAAGLILACAAMVVLLIFKSGVALNPYNRPLCLILLSVPPVVAMLLRDGHRRLAVILVALAACAVVPSVSNAAVLALLIGVVVALITALLPPKPAAWLLGAAIVAAVGALVPVFHGLAVVFPQPAWMPWSAYHRVEIYDYLAHLILQRPWTGWGLSTFREIPFDPAQFPHFIGFAEVLLHGHNNFLEAWSDLGIAGFVLVLLLPLAAIRWATHLPRAARALAFGGVASGTVIAALSFGFTQTNWIVMPAWAAMLWLLAQAHLHKQVTGKKAAADA